MRMLAAAVLAVCVGACGGGAGGVVRDLAPVYANPMDHNGRTFDGIVHIVPDANDPSIYRLSQTADGAQSFALQSGAQQRLQDWYHLNPGHTFHARGLLRPTPCGERNNCSAGEPRFTLMNMQVLRRSGQ